MYFHRGQRLLLAVALLGVSTVAFADNKPYYNERSTWDEATQGPLPHWRDGGRQEVAYDTLHPYVVPSAADAPETGLVTTPPEFAPVDGVLYRYSTTAWPVVVRDLVVALTSDPSHDEIAYVVVSDANQRNVATSQFSAAGADMSKVVFIIAPNNSIWMRDYGPHFVYQGENIAVVDSHYYPGRSLDNFLPTLLGDDFFEMPTYDIGLYYSGGNYQADTNRNGYITSLIHSDNPGFGEPFIAELYNKYQGVDNLIVFPALPPTVDGTGHIDMWFYLIDDDTAVISEFIPGSNPTAISITNNAADFMEDVMGFEVFRVPDSNGFHPQANGAHFTYANAFRVNDRIFIPSYGQGNASHNARDAQALATWQQAAGPGIEIVPINCYDIIPAAGAIHCIVKQVPRYTAINPAARVLSPSGGNVITGGSQYDIAWAADDDEGVDSIDLAYSVDGGESFQTIINNQNDSGNIGWIVPEVGTSEAMIKVTAYDDDANFGEGVSEDMFRIVNGTQRFYDFTSGGGVDKWVHGYQTTSWGSINGNRRPTSASIEVDTLDGSGYSRLATSNANGGDSDLNRYRSRIPAAGQESTHIAEFTIYEEIEDILDIEIVWESYADDCTQAEVYVWDDVEGNWGDTRGFFGDNRHFDNHATNVDEILGGHITLDFDRYINGDGLLTLLHYAERSRWRTFHDHILVTVTYAYNGDMDDNGQWNLDDIDLFNDCMTGPGGGILPGCDRADTDADYDVDFADFRRLQDKVGE